MKEHADRLTRPETRVLSIMRVSAQALEPSVAVDQAEVQKTFNFRKDTLATPETRSIVQIVAPDAKAAGVIAQRLAKGDQPAVVASAYGRQPVMIADKPKSALPDRKVADAAFSLAVGQASGPITGDLGVSVIKVHQDHARNGGDAGKRPSADRGRTARPERPDQGLRPDPDLSGRPRRRRRT
jgi:peptidyl-prolyl cis-trans isomerase D